MGKLTNTEKYAIKGMLSDNREPAEIAKALGRPLNVVTKYIEGELSDVLDHVVKGKLESHENESLDPIVDDETEVATEEDLPYVSDEIMKEAVKQLKAGGLTERDAWRIVEITASKAEEKGIRFKDADKFYTACIGRMNAGHFMVKKGNSGTEGVAMMTGAASQRGDTRNYSRKKGMNLSRSTEGCVFDTKKKKIV